MVMMMATCMLMMIRMTILCADNDDDDDAGDDKDDHSLCSRRGAPCSLIGAHACPLKTPPLSPSPQP